jgi:hypothetical protein
MGLLLLIWTAAVLVGWSLSTARAWHRRGEAPCSPVGTWGPLCIACAAWIVAMGLYSSSQADRLFPPLTPLDLVRLGPVGFFGVLLVPSAWLLSLGLRAGLAVPPRVVPGGDDQVHDRPSREDAAGGRNSRWLCFFVAGCFFAVGTMGGTLLYLGWR